MAGGIAPGSLAVTFSTHQSGLSKWADCRSVLLSQEEAMSSPSIRNRTILSVPGKRFLVSAFFYFLSIWTFLLYLFSFSSHSVDFLFVSTSCLLCSRASLHIIFDKLAHKTRIHAVVKQNASVASGNKMFYQQNWFGWVHNKLVRTFVFTEIYLSKLSA